MSVQATDDDDVDVDVDEDGDEVELILESDIVAHNMRTNQEQNQTNWIQPMLKSVRVQIKRKKAAVENKKNKILHLHQIWIIDYYIIVYVLFIDVMSSIHQ